MTFPRETEDQIRRTVLDTGQEHIRKVMEATRELTNMVSDFAEKNAKEMDAHLSQIKKLKDEAAERKQVLLRELAESGMLLINREDFLRLAVQVGEILDLCEGAAHRLNYIAKHNVKITDELRSGFLALSKNVLKTVTNLRETVLSLSYSRQRALELAKSVEVAEYAVDEMYRELEIKIIEQKFEIGPTLLLWSLAEFLEDISDKAEDAIDSTRVLALGV
jgi:predicted phosphate transport protein (TIGR00153 family)